MSKIPTFTPVVETKVRCKNCNHPHHHRHGFYYRKATHRQIRSIRVLRCQCLRCLRTFGVLPQDLLPIIRWRLTSVRYISHLLTSGISYWKVARMTRCTLGVIQRLALKLPSLVERVQQLSRHRGIGEKLDPQSSYSNILLLPGQWPSWHQFSYELSLLLYPLRHKAKEAPHEM